MNQSNKLRNVIIKPQPKQHTNISLKKKHKNIKRKELIFIHLKQTLLKIIIII